MNKPAKKQTKRSIKKVVNKPAKKQATAPRASQKKLQGVVAVSSKVLEPMKDGNKFAVPATWISTKQVVVMLQRTPKEHVFVRQGKGNQSWEYVTGHYVEKVLNYAFGWNWDFEIITQNVYGLENDKIDFAQVVVQGRLTVKDEKGNQIVKSQFGRADVKMRGAAPLDLGNDFKAAATDALKKCASLLGIASDIYGKKEFKDLGASIKPDGGQTPINAAPIAPQADKVVKTPIVEVTNDQKTTQCHLCTRILTQAEANYTTKLYKVPLCRECEKVAKDK